MTAQTSVRRMRNGKCWVMQEARTTGKTRKRRHKCLDMTRALLLGLSGVYWDRSALDTLPRLILFVGLPFLPFLLLDDAIYYSFPCSPFPIPHSLFPLFYYPSAFWIAFPASVSACVFSVAERKEPVCWILAMIYLFLFHCVPALFPFDLLVSPRKSVLVSIVSFCGGISPVWILHRT